MREAGRGGEASFQSPGYYTFSLRPFCTNLSTFPLNFIVGKGSIPECTRYVPKFANVFPAPPRGGEISLPPLKLSPSKPPPNYSTSGDGTA